MLERLSANALIKSVIGTLAVVLVASLAVGVKDRWDGLATSKRTLAVAEVSGEAFRVMLNQRTDRSTTARTWAAAGPITPGTAEYLGKLRAAEMPALGRTIALLDGMVFEGQAGTVAELRRLQGVLEKLQAEHSAGVLQPKAARRPGLGDEYVAAGTAMQAVLEQVSARLIAQVKVDDALVGQLMQIKELAWMVRNTAGEASLLISNGLAAGKVAPDAKFTYARQVGGSEALWAAIENTMYGLPLAPGFAQSVAKAKAILFAPDYMATRERLIDALMAGTNPGMTPDEWSPYTVPKLGATQDVAEAALEAARLLASGQRDAAWTGLLTHGAGMLGAILLAGLSLLAVDRRLIGPLHGLRDAMLRLSGGDLSVQAPYADRRDEIGALAGALAVFQQQAKDKASIEAEQQQQQMEEAARQQAVAAQIRTFEQQIGQALSGLGEASQAMDSSSVEMETIAAESNGQAQAAAMAAQETSNNVAGIAAATEQLSASISEISRQVTQATVVTGRAVEETRQTDATVQGLAESAGRIGEVVKLISDIAGRTNLLALNATIEAARAGDAGKGFAVVASEVKSLANQTAKATEEISAQINAVRDVTDNAVKAIRQIGITIGEVSSVATSIAAGVEEQGASTQEIARNTQQAARLTQEMSQTVALVTRGADATGATAQAVKTAAGTLGSRAEQLRGQVQTFLGGIRAA